MKLKYIYVAYWNNALLPEICFLLPWHDIIGSTKNLFQNLQGGRALTISPADSATRPFLSCRDLKLSYYGLNDLLARNNGMEGRKPLRVTASSYCIVQEMAMEWTHPHALRHMRRGTLNVCAYANFIDIAVLIHLSSSCPNLSNSWCVANERVHSTGGFHSKSSTFKNIKANKPS